jgi:hypothetical protein
MLMIVIKSYILNVKNYVKQILSNELVKVMNEMIINNI